MHNVSHKVVGDKLIIEVDISSKALSDAPPSKTGKTALVGTTGGAIGVSNKSGGNVTFALNVMTKK
jgi:hypothetical protein